jgi:hypothetical protein
MTASTLADCCPKCPGEEPPSSPLDVCDEGTGSLRADYQCTACGHRWSCWWDASSAGWSLALKALGGG